MSPDEHAEEAEHWLRCAASQWEQGDESAAGVLSQMAGAHALLAQRPQQVELVHETTSTDEMATFTETQGLDDIREWHAEAAPKAARLDDFDAWLHVRDVGKLLGHIDRQDGALDRDGAIRERLRAESDHRKYALKTLIEMVRHVAGEIGDEGGSVLSSYAHRLDGYCRQAERELAEGPPGDAVPPTGEDGPKEALARIMAEAEPFAHWHLVAGIWPAGPFRDALNAAKAVLEGDDNRDPSTGEDQSGDCPLDECVLPAHAGPHLAGPHEEAPSDG